MSDIAIFSENDMFLQGLMGFAPLGLLLLVTYFLRSIEKQKAAKVLFIATGLYLLVGLGICAGLTGGF